MSWRYLCVGVGVFFCQAASAYDLLLPVTGVIAANGCVVSSQSQNMTIEMGDIALKQFYANDVGFGKHSFIISLENCGTAATGVKVTFKGTADSNNAELLQLTQESGVAQGLAIELLDTQGERAPINRQMDLVLPITLAAGEKNEYEFSAKYRSTGPVSVGLANATANFFLEYQ